MTPELLDKENVNPPASFDEIAKLEKFIGHSLPEDLVDLYKQYNGLSIDKKSDYCVPMRLMPIQEVIEYHQLVNGAGPDNFLSKKNFLVRFWTDDQSNEAGYLLEDPLSGFISFSDHEGDYLGDYSPVFGTTSEFLDSLCCIYEFNKNSDLWESEEISDQELVTRTKNNKKFWYKCPTTQLEWNSVVQCKPLTTDENRVNEIITLCENEINSSSDLEFHLAFYLYTLARISPDPNHPLFLKYLDDESDMYIPGTLSLILLTRFGSIFVPKALQTLESAHRNNESVIIRGLLNSVLKGNAKEKEILPFLETEAKELYMLWKSWETPDFE